MKIVIADAEQHYRRYLRRVLESEKGISVVAETSDGEEAVRLAQKLGPNVVLMDIDLQGVDGLAATSRVKTRVPGVKVIVLSSVEGEAYRQAASRHGADGFLCKAAPLTQVLNTVRALGTSGRPV